VQGKGVNLPPDGYLAGAQELCRRYGTLFAVDEVQTGFGRTGKLFAFEHWGLEPDLVTVAKSLSGGYVPVGVLLMARGVYDAVFDSLEHSVSHGSTFAPNDLAMAAGSRDASRARREGACHEVGASRRGAAATNERPRGRARGRTRGSRPRADVGLGVR
jgi:ornithine--oxo-acid transaminase